MMELMVINMNMTTITLYENKPILQNLMTCESLSGLHG